MGYSVELLNVSTNLFIDEEYRLAVYVFEREEGGDWDSHLLFSTPWTWFGDTLFSYPVVYGDYEIVCVRHTYSTDYGFSYQSTSHIFRKTIGGSWSEIATLPQALFFLGCGEGSLFGSYLGTAYFSDDNGETWETASSLDDSLDAAAMNPTGYGYLIGRSNDGGTYVASVHRTDDGEHWDSFSLGNTSSAGLVSVAARGQTVFAALSAGGGYLGYLSTDDGENWTELSSMPAHQLDSYNLSVAVSEEAIYLSARARVFRAELDDPSSWSTILDLEDGWHSWVGATPDGALAVQYVINESLTAYDEVEDETSENFWDMSWGSLNSDTSETRTDLKVCCGQLGGPYSFWW